MVSVFLCTNTVLGSGLRDTLSRDPEPARTQSADNKIYGLNDNLALAPRSITADEEGKAQWEAGIKQIKEGRSKGKIVFWLSSALISTGLVAYSFIQYSNLFHFIGTLSILWLFTSAIILAYTIAYPGTRKAIASSVVLLPMTLIASAAVRLFPISRFPWMDEVFYTAKGMDGILRNVWDAKMTELPYAWSTLAGLAGLSIHPMYGPKLLAIAFSVGTIYLAYRFTSDFLSVVHKGHEALRNRAEWVAALAFGLSGTALYTGLMSVHDSMGAFYLMLSMVMLHKAERAEAPNVSRNYHILSQFSLLLGMYSKYGLFVYGPFYLAYALALRLDLYPKLPFKKNLLNWFTKIVIPLGSMTALSAYAFRQELAAGYADSKDAIVKLAQYVVFPRIEILGMMVKHIGVYIFFAAWAFIAKFEKSWLKVALFVLGMSTLYDHLARSHIQGMIKHYTFVLALLSPLIATGIVSVNDFLQQRLKPKLRVIFYAAFTALIVHNIYLPYTGSFSWWITDNRYPVKSARVIRDNLSKGKKVAAREFTPAFVAGFDHTRVIKINRETDPDTIVKNPDIEMVELYPEEKLLIPALEKAGFKKIFSGPPLVLLRKLGEAVPAPGTQPRLPLIPPNEINLHLRTQHLIDSQL